MTRKNVLGTVAVTIVLLPGLLAAAPLQGPCGLCGNGPACAGGCPERASREMASAGCCGESADETTAPAATRVAGCDCGRQAPPGVAAAQGPLTEPGHAVALHVADGGGVPQRQARSEAGRSRPAPTPSPPLFLVVCSFLT